MSRPVALVVTAEPVGHYQGWHMQLNGQPIGHMPYDGSNAEEACDKVVTELALLLRERLGWSVEAPDDDDYA